MSLNAIILADIAENLKTRNSFIKLRMNYGRNIVKVGCEGRRDEVVTACFKGILMLRKRTKTLCTDDQSVGHDQCVCHQHTAA